MLHLLYNSQQLKMQTVPETFLSWAPDIWCWWTACLRAEEDVAACWTAIAKSRMSFSCPWKRPSRPKRTRVVMLARMMSAFSLRIWHYKLNCSIWKKTINMASLIRKNIHGCHPKNCDCCTPFVHVIFGRTIGKSSPQCIQNFVVEITILKKRRHL